MPDMSASASQAMTHLVVFAKEVDEDKVTPGVLGFIVFAAMALAVWALMRSMNRHMGKVDFAEPADGAGNGDGEGRTGSARERGASQEAETSGPAGPRKG
ncbi:hypothetical protein ABZ354_21685 [Streptomyces sp. NPDC005925]|uniref:hypothetical protein n=1 Tax=Streptomyces sp. NPDC005925 TaxID=3157172 RepID=UPI0033DCEB0C